MINLDPAVRNWFIKSGWTENHSANVPANIPLSHPAHEILRVFGGIKLLEIDCPDGEEPIEEYVFRPLSTTWREITNWSKRIRSKLIGIAEVHNDHGELYVDETGRCFSNSLIHDAFAFAGDSLSDTLQGTINHRKNRPLLRPWQPSVSMYGEWIMQGDPRVYDYRSTT